MICYACDNSNWKKLDVTEQKQMMVCKTCGNLVYEVDPADEPKIKQYYTKEYRGRVSHMNLLTTNRKLQYVMKFLDPILKEANEQKKKLVCGDIGCATGYLVNALRRMGHKATGSEWTISMRRMAEHYYGIPITEELETKHKYDLLIMYHVLEHLIQPDKKLEHYQSLMQQDGKFLISTPRWLDVLEEPGGMPLTTFDHIFHKDHINIFTENSIKRLFLKCGFIWEYENHNVYGQTYILKRINGECPIDPKSLYENPDEVELKLRLAKEAISLFKERKYREAIEKYPKFPEAYINHIMNTNVRKDVGLAKDVFDEALKVMPDNLKLNLQYGIWLYQQEKFEEALKIYDMVLKVKPTEDIFVYKGWCLKMMGQGKEASKYFNTAATMNPQKWIECQDQIISICTDIPCWQEKAENELKEKLLQESKVNIKPIDKVMDEEIEKDKNILEETRT